MLGGRAVALQPFAGPRIGGGGPPPDSPFRVSLLTASTCFWDNKVELAVVV